MGSPDTVAPEVDGIIVLRFRVSNSMVQGFVSSTVLLVVTSSIMLVSRPGGMASPHSCRWRRALGWGPERGPGPKSRW